jgi:hypothetical protein
MSKTLYEKRGNRYYPVLERDVWGASDVWAEGFHLVACRPGLKTIRYNIQPDNAAVIASMTIHADELSKMLMEAGKAELTAPEKITPEQLEAWKNLKEAFNGGPFYVNYESSLGIARKFLSYLENLEKEGKL